MLPDTAYDAADEWLKRRLNVATTLGSQGIADAVRADLRQWAFFSSRVASARIVAALRELSDAYSRGEIGRADARSRLKEFLAEDPEAGGVPALAKTGRLNLILDQNRRMAQAVGRYQVSMDPDVVERYPYWRYITGPNPRDSHAQLDGLVLRKDDPFWATHFPPWEFNCNCDVEEVAEDELGDYGGAAKRGPDLAPAASGYRFNPAEAFAGEFEVDASLPADLRDKLMEGFDAKAG